MNDPAKLAYSTSRTLYPRFGRPSDVANAALLLTSHECPFIGENLMVDGGLKAASNDGPLRTAGRGNSTVSASMPTNDCRKRHPAGKDLRMESSLGARILSRPDLVMIGL